MRFFATVISAAALLSLAPAPTHALKILMNNDDGFGSGNLREFYRILKGMGHDGSSPPIPLKSPSPSPC